MKYFRWGGRSGEMQHLHPAGICSWIVPMDHINGNNFYTVCLYSVLLYYHKAIVSLQPVSEQKDDTIRCNNIYLSLKSRLQDTPSIVCRKLKMKQYLFLKKNEQIQISRKDKPVSVLQWKSSGNLLPPHANLAIGAWLKGWAASSC